MQTSFYRDDTMELDELRTEIDSIDQQIVDLMARRMELAKRSAEHKADVEDDKREAQVLASVVEHAGDRLDQTFLRIIYLNMIKESKRLQEMDQ